MKAEMATLIMYEDKYTHVDQSTKIEIFKKLDWE